MIKDRLGAKPLVMQVPIGIEASLKGVVDLNQNESSSMEK